MHPCFSDLLPFLQASGAQFLKRTFQSFGRSGFHLRLWQFQFAMVLLHRLLPFKGHKQRRAGKWLHISGTPTSCILGGQVASRHGHMLCSGLSFPLSICLLFVPSSPSFLSTWTTHQPFTSSCLLRVSQILPGSSASYNTWTALSALPLSESFIHPPNCASIAELGEAQHIPPVAFHP